MTLSALRAQDALTRTGEDKRLLMKMHNTNNDAVEVSPHWPAPRTRAVVMIAMAFGTSILLTGWIGPQEEDFLTGQLSAHVVSVRADGDGRIEKWLVDVDQKVDHRAKLLALVDDDIEASRAKKREQVTKLTSQLRWKRAQAEIDLAWRLRTLETEVLANRMKSAELLQREFDYRLDLRVQQESLKSGRRPIRTATPDELFRPVSFREPITQLTRMTTVGDSRLATMRQHETVRNAAEVTNVQLQLCEKRLRELAQLKRDLPAKVREASGVAMAERQLEQARKELAELEKQPSKRTLLSPAYGQVQPVALRPGQRLRRGEVFARIIDHERRFLTVPVPGEKLARFSVGQSVVLRFPGVKPCTGKVAALRGDDDGRVIAVIEPTGRLWPDQPMGTSVDVLVPKTP